MATPTMTTTATVVPGTTPAFPSSAPGGFDIQPAAITGAAGCFDSEASALTTASVSLNQQLQQLGACWGKDEVGTRFGTEYQAAAEAVMDNLESLAVGMFRIGSALRAVAGACLRGEDDLLTLIRNDEGAIDENPLPATPAAVIL